MLAVSMQLEAVVPTGVFDGQSFIQSPFYRHCYCLRLSLFSNAHAQQRTESIGEGTTLFPELYILIPRFL